MSSAVRGRSVSVNASAVLNLSGSNSPFAGNLTNNSGFLILSSTAAAGSGTVVFKGGFVVVASGTTVTNNFYITSATTDLNMMATNSGTGVWAGDVHVGSGAQWRPGSDGGSLTFLGNAAIGSSILVLPRGSLTFASNATAISSVSGFIGRDSSGNKRSLNLTIRDNASVGMAGCSFGGGKTGSSVTVTLQNNASLSFGANTIDLMNINNSAALSTVRLNGGTFTVGGFTKTSTGNTNIIDFNGGMLMASENNSSFLPVFSPSTNLVQAGGAVINDGGFAITIAGLLLHDPGLGATPDGGLTKLGAGTLTLTASEGFTGPATILAGRLAITDGKGLANASTIQIAPGAVLDVGGVGGNYTLTSGQKLAGNGAIVGGIRLLSGAALAPGSNAIGTLTFSNALWLGSGGTSIFKLTHSPLTNDSAVVMGGLTNAGTLVVSNIGSAPLAAGDAFPLFNAGSYTGSFSSVQLPPLAAGLAWNTNLLNSAGVISVVLNTAPVIGSISISGNGLGLSGTGGVGNAYYVLLGSTNLGGIWTPLLTNQFDNSGNFNFTTNANTGTPQNFYRLQLQ